MVMDFNGFAVFVCASDAPLRAAERELSGHGRVVYDNIHMRLQSDIARHRLPNSRRTAGYFAGPMDLVQLNHSRVRMVHCGRSLDIMRVESFRKPNVNQFW
jgi:hypothetical protein